MSKLIKCCIKKCGLERPRSEMRPHKSSGRLTGYRCRDRHGFQENNAYAGTALVKCKVCQTTRVRSEMHLHVSNHTYTCKDQELCAKSSS